MNGSNIIFDMDDVGRPRDTDIAMAEDELSLAVEIAAPTESRAELAMRARIAARLDLDLGQEAQLIGRYELVRRLGAGGMGVVYEARDPQLDRPVAVKMLRPERTTDSIEGHERLHREARALAKLSHPNVVQIHEVGEHEGITYVVMELVRGQTLHEWQRSNQPVLTNILAAYRQAGLGLAAAHEAGIIHRDFKPSNALIGDDGRVRVVDFGLARSPARLCNDTTAPTHEGSSSTGVAGTPGYIAPEVLAGNAADARSDQFSFCVALWEAVSGIPPSAQPHDGRASAGRNTTFPGPAWLRRVILRGIAEDPGERWPDLPTLVRALDRRPRRQLLFALGLPILGLAAGLALQPMIHDSTEREDLTDPCADLPREFEQIWTDDSAAQLRAYLASVGRSDAEAELVVRALDRQRARWLETEHRICEATHVISSWSSDLSDTASACLEDKLGQSRELIGLLSPALGEPPGNIRALVANLEDPRECADLDALAERPSGEVDTVIVTMRQAIARTRLLLAAQMQHGDEESERLLARARELRQAHPDDDATQWALAEALELRAAAEQWRQRPDLAWPLLREAMPLVRRSGDLELELRCLHRMGYMAAEQLEDPERAADFIAIAAGLVPLVQPTKRSTFEHAMTRAELARARQQLDEAEAILRAALEAPDVDESIDAPSKDRARLRLANVLADRGRLDDALTIYMNLRNSLAVQVGESSPDIGFVEFNIGQTLHDAGDHEQDAERHLRAASSILERSFGPNSVRLAPTLTVMAEIALSDSRFDEALSLANRAWALQRDQLPPGHGDRGQPLKVIAGVHSLTGDFEAALPIYELMAKELRMDAEDAAALAHVTGWTKCRLGRCMEARADFEDAQSRASSSQVRVYASVGLAEVDIVSGRPTDALDRLEPLRPLLEREFADDLALRVEVEWLSARALVDARKDRKRAREHLRRAMDDAGPSTPPGIVADLEKLEKSLNAAGN